MTGTKVEAIHHHGVPATDGFVVGRVLSAEQHPDADRLKVCTVQLDGDGGEPRQHRLRSPQRRRRADGRGCPPGGGDARRHQAAPGQAPRRHLRRDDPVRERARDRRRAGRASWCSTSSRSTPSSHPERRWRACSRSPSRCSSWRSRPTGPTASASTESPASCTPPPARRWPRSRGRVTPAASAARRRRSAGAVPRPLPPLHRARVRGRHARALAAVAESAPDRRRAAHDQQRRRHHQLRDAAHRAAAARLRPRPRGGLTADGPPRHRGRAGADPRRPDPHPRRRDGRDRGRHGARPRSPA